VTNSPAEMRALISREITMWRSVVQAGDIRMER
jgi:hypothetical protein